MANFCLGGAGDHSKLLWKVISASSTLICTLSSKNALN